MVIVKSPVKNILGKKMDLCQQNLDGVKKVTANNKIVTQRPKSRKKRKKRLFNSFHDKCILII